MLKIKSTPKTPTKNVVKMMDMKPLEVGIIEKSEGFYGGDYVMRTYSEHQFEVMNLSNPKEGGCWSGDCPMRVRLLNKGEKINIELFN